LKVGMQTETPGLLNQTSPGDLAGVDGS
jgi:hypothetical protein